MLQRIPDTLDADAVRVVLGTLGLADAVDAVYVPTRNTRPHRNASYAFVNFVTPEDAERRPQASRRSVRGMGASPHCEHSSLS